MVAGVGQRGVGCTGLRFWAGVVVAGGSVTSFWQVVTLPLSFGTQSANGSRFVETLLSVIVTCHQQQRDPWTYLTTAIQAHLKAQPTPSLLPGV
ncbi:MAG: hypothetical protein KDA58_03780 [Planctomycetaceae bacterium]|nr:hypothetical protein [Planctomycetaceae bacterium]